MQRLISTSIPVWPTFNFLFTSFPLSIAQRKRTQKNINETKQKYEKRKSQPPQ